jgi:glycosyltransferase involved in cell wall biosynthesis
MSQKLRIGFDARYIRVEHHDGISRFSARIGSELQKIIDSHPDISLTFLISDERQRAHLPPNALCEVISSPTSIRERSVARQVNRFGFDTVFSPMQTMGSRGKRYRLVLTVHDLIYYRHPMPPRSFSLPVRLLWRLYHLSWWPQRWLLNASDAVVAVSATTKALISEHQLTRKPVFVVHNAAEALPHVMPGQRTKSLVYMGSFMPYKNVETLVATVQRLPGYTLDLLSRIHPRDRARLIEMDKNNQVVFHNGVSDEEYARLLAGAACAVTASLDEGFGIPVIEAMAAGTPVICSDIPIFGEVAGSAAIFVQARDVEGFAKAVTSLENSETFNDAQRSGLRQADLFSWQKSAQELFDVLIQVSA